ncbi:MAG: TraR/DksA C4-type zinc finger protein [Pseudomonadota bacterium]|uniref:TraR/DksA family transcriptional regulator n=1 Tax=Alloalcanivorax venustensis TaxID=172371 RepID=UPI002EBA79D4|nr:TraR/DksA C4-type zinc finger protein [Pseudomonadota bacterium]
MDPTWLETLKQQLEALRETLSEEDAEADNATRPVELDQASVGRLSRMDAMQRQAMALETRRRNALRLKKVELALVRIEQGEYGLCEDCDEEINPKRLRFDPTTTLCLACASTREG